MAEQLPDRIRAMERAVAACHQALVDYQSGFLDEDQLRRALARDRRLLVDGEAWLLDVAGGVWRRDDCTERIAMDALDDVVTAPTFDADTLGRWQRALRGLQATTALTGLAGR